MRVEQGQKNRKRIVITVNSEEEVVLLKNRIEALESIGKSRNPSFDSVARSPR